ncbi:hypothetical protein D918_01120 [Trichuris suis]|nr:hypothetical protein D918_01120 [Trichuris suis]
MFNQCVFRFIGLIFELAGTGNFVSLTNSLESIGIPRWIVRARNEAAHGHLPPVTVLRKALDFSLSWFNDVCWSGDPKLCVSVHKVKSSQKRFVTYVATLNRYIRLRHQLCSPKLTPSDKLIRKTKVIEQRIRNWVLLDRDQLFRSLFTVSFKPSCKALGEKGRDAGYLLKLWKSVLLYIAEAFLLPNLLWTISNCVATDAQLIPAQADDHLAMQWLLKLVADEDFSSSTGWDSAFQLLLSEAPYGNKELLTRVAERCRLSSEKMEVLKKLEDMQYLSTSSAIVCPKPKAQTMRDEDIKRYRQSQEFVSRTLPIYSISDDSYDWATIPIGTLPWSDSDVTNLRFAQETVREETALLSDDAAKNVPIIELGDKSAADNADEHVAQSTMEADGFNLDEYGCYRRREAVDVAAIAQRVFDRVRCGFGQCP